MSDLESAHTSHNTTYANPEQESIRDIYTAFGEHQKRRRSEAIRRASGAQVPMALLASWAENEEWRRRESVARLLGEESLEDNVDREAIIHILQSMVNDAHWRVSVAAIEAIGHGKITEAIEVLHGIRNRPGVVFSRRNAIEFSLLQLAHNEREVPHQLLGLQYMRHSHKHFQLRTDTIKTLYELWTEDHTQFVLNETWPRVHQWQLQSAEAFKSDPLPSWLNGVEEMRMDIPLMRLVQANLLGIREAFDIMSTRLNEEGVTPQSIYELLNTTRHYPYIQQILTIQLGAHSVNIARVLVSWLDHDLGELAPIAISWLGQIPEVGKKALPKLLHIMLSCEQELQGIIRSAVHNVIHLDSVQLDEAELFTFLRTLLYHKVDRNTWRLLALLLESCVEEEHVEVVIDYIDMHLSDDVRQQQSQFRRWVLSLAEEEPSPFLRLLRQLVISPIISKYPMDGPLLRKILSCPHLTKITHLDMQNVMLTPELIDALKGIDGPKSITHLYIGNTKMQGESVAKLLTNLALPNLTHLYMSNLGHTYHIGLAEHPVLEQLQHLNLKNSIHAPTCHELLCSQRFGNLRKLNIRNNNLTIKHIELLLNEGSLSRGCILDVRDNKLADTSTISKLAVDKGIQLYL